MGNDSELLRLEQFVEKLLQKFSSLKAERDHLLQSVAEKRSDIADHKLVIKEKEDVIAARDEKIAQLEAQLSEKDDERVAISTKVSSIMEQIESWELSLEEDDAAGLQPDESSVEEEFTTAAEPAEKPAEADDEGVLPEKKEKQVKEERIQCDLF